MNNYEHFERRNIASETNYRNKHRERLTSEPVAPPIPKIDISRLFTIVHDFSGYVHEMFIKSSNFPSKN